MRVFDLRRICDFAFVYIGRTIFFWVHFRLSLKFPGQQDSASSVVQTGASHIPADEFPH